jgi:ribosomal protein S27E
MSIQELTPFEKAAVFLHSLPDDISFQFKLHFKFSQLERMERAARKALRKIKPDKGALIADFLNLDKPPTGEELAAFVQEHFPAVLLRIKRAVFPAEDRELAGEAVRNILAGKPVAQGALLLANLPSSKIVEALSGEYSTSERVAYVKEIESIYEFYGEPIKTLREVVRGLAAADEDFLLAWEMAEPLPMLAKYGIEILGLMRRLGRTFEELCMLSAERVRAVLRHASDLQLAVLLKSETSSLKDKFFSEMPLERVETVRKEISLMPSVTIKDSWQAREDVLDIIRRLWQEDELTYLENNQRRVTCPDCGALTVIPVEKRRLVVTCESCSEMFIIKPEKGITRRHSEIRLRLGRKLKLPSPTAEELGLIMREFERELDELKENIKLDYFGYRPKEKLPKAIKKKLKRVLTETGRKVAQDFSYNLFVNSSIILISLRQKTGMEATLTLPEHNNIYLLSAAGREEKILIEMDRPLVSSIVRLLSDPQKRRQEPGGLGLGASGRRIFHQFISKFAREFSAAAALSEPLSFDIEAFFDTPADVEDYSPHQDVIHATFDMALDDVRGALNICIPVALVMSIFGDGA